MSELLSKNSQNLSISTKNNTELKLKYDELKKSSKISRNFIKRMQML